MPFDVFGAALELLAQVKAENLELIARKRRKANARHTAQLP
jgi:hypothetical protein